MVFAIGKTKHPVDLFLGVRFLVLHVLANCQIGFKLEPLWSKDVQTPIPHSESPTFRKIFTSNISDSCLSLSPAGPILLVSSQVGSESEFFPTPLPRNSYLLMYTSVVLHQVLSPLKPFTTLFALELTPFMFISSVVHKSLPTFQNDVAQITFSRTLLLHNLGALCFLLIDHPLQHLHVLLLLLQPLLLHSGFIIVVDVIDMIHFIILVDFIDMIHFIIVVDFIDMIHFIIVVDVIDMIHFVILVDFIDLIHLVIVVD